MRKQKMKRKMNENMKEKMSQKQNSWEFARRYWFITSMHAHTDANIKEFWDHLREIVSQKTDFTFALRTCMWTVTWNNAKTFTLCSWTAWTAWIAWIAWMLIRKLALSHLHSSIHLFIYSSIHLFIHSSIIVALIHRPYYKIDIHTIFWHKHVMRFLLRWSSFWFERFIEQ
jgi:hypothetical protein